MKKSAFTLIELLISIIILSILMLFLYKSYAGLNRSNSILGEEVEKISQMELFKKSIYLDFTTAMGKNIIILPQNPHEDVVFLQTSNSVHNRINPYVGYIVKEKMLYRVESLKPLKEYPLSADSEFVVEAIGKVKIFRVYPSKNPKSKQYLVHILFESEEEILLKLNPLYI